MNQNYWKVFIGIFRRYHRESPAYGRRIPEVNYVHENPSIPIYKKLYNDQDITSNDKERVIHDMFNGVHLNMDDVEW